MSRSPDQSVLKYVSIIDKTLSISSRDLFKKGEHPRKRMIETCAKYSLLQVARARHLSMVATAIGV